MATKTKGSVINDKVQQEFIEDSVKTYLKEIGRVPLLSRKEEIDLAKKLNRETKKPKSTS